MDTHEVEDVKDQLGVIIDILKQHNEVMASLKPPKGSNPSSENFENSVEKKLQALDRFQILYRQRIKLGTLIHQQL